MYFLAFCLIKCWPRFCGTTKILVWPPGRCFPAEFSTWWELSLIHIWEKVLSLGTLSVYQQEAYSDTFLFEAEDATGIYLFNERGECVADSYSSYFFLEREGLILAEDAVSGKFGACLLYTSFEVFYEDYRPVKGRNRL